MKELAGRLSVSPPELIKYLMTNGVMASLNDAIDFDTASIAADHFGFEAQSEEAERESAPSGERRAARHPSLDLSSERAQDLVERPPVVTVLGHVDHGKTSLLDTIRRTKVTETEAGGITQRIGAYQVTRGDRTITFIDTPGHAAFTAMRARGADITDIAVLIVAADDGVMPQTEEAIQHARSAGVPIVVAINKIDKEGASPNRVIQQLVERGIVPEELGGDVQVVNTSARTGEGIDDLLDMILLVSEFQDLKANPKRPAAGTVVESRLERGRGPIATVLVQNGTLRPGDHIVAGPVYGKVRTLTDETGRRVNAAGPGTPVVVSGLGDVATAGEIFHAAASEKVARGEAEERALEERRRQLQPVRRKSLADLAAEGDGTKTLNLILKAEAHGSLEALRGQVVKIEDPTVRLKVVATGVGEIGESDVDLAAASGSIIIGFNVKPDDRARAAAEDRGVDIRYYDVIYHITDDIEKAIKGLYKPRMIEVFQGRAEVRKVFTVDGKNAIAGSHVIDGKVSRNAVFKVLRDGREIASSRVNQLRRAKDDVREVARDYDCGITLQDFADFAEGDILEAYVVEQQNL